LLVLLPVTPPWLLHQQTLPVLPLLLLLPPAILEALHKHPITLSGRHGPLIPFLSTQALHLLQPGFPSLLHHDLPRPPIPQDHIHACISPLLLRLLK
jgi:hypothetical protein